jgi:hypothetical protein
MELTAEQLLIKIGILVMENDALKAENVELWKKEKQRKKSKEDEAIQKQRL